VSGAWRRTVPARSRTLSVPLPRAARRVPRFRLEWRAPGKGWQRAPESAEISGMQHNVLGGFLDVRPAVYACGSGKATLRSFRYFPEARVPA